ncbi:MAG: M14 family metallopeptidase [Acidobacteria bacterium]|nr:M14 family metallopeptidase [Acidobacteriota bacterium]
MRIRHLRTSSVVAVVGVGLAGTAVLGQTRPGTALDGLQTRAERSGFTETSRYDDVQTFLATVDQASGLVHLTSFGYTFEGRSLPLAVVGRLADARPATVKASGRLRVYLQANIHAGEVEGKEAVLALIRDIARGQHADWLTSMVLLVNPIYNADGNEKVTLTSRGFQHGPIGGQGTRPNAQGLNINRDNIKLETPEARSMVRLLNDFDPHVMVDLHTTNGSRHAYHLTYETPNNPAVDAGIVAQSRDWMAAVTKNIRTKDKWEFRSYGNVSGQAPNRVWTTVEDLPRYTHNYWGMRNRFGILSETYSYLPFAERVTTDRRYLEEVLGYAHANATALMRATAAADAAPLVGSQLSIRSEVTRASVPIEILMGDVGEDVNPYSGKIIHKRANVVKPEPMADETTFAATDHERVPAAYFVPAEQKAAIERLRAHGIQLERVDAPLSLPLEEFTVTTSVTTPREFESHQERTVTGTWTAVDRTVPAGAYRVTMTQPLARLAFYLLEPRSNDGLVTWNVLDEALKTGHSPVLRSRN